MKKLSKHAKLTFFIFLLLMGAIPQIRLVVASSQTGIDPKIDPNQWVPSLWGGAKIKQDNGVTITTNSSYDMSGAKVYTAYKFTGDFDVQVDYREGMGWDGEYASYRNDPHIFAAGMGIFSGELQYSILRYIAYYKGRLTHHVAVFDTLNWVGPGRFDKTGTSYSGKYRIIRTGSDVVFEWGDGSYWDNVYKLSGIDEPVSIYLGAESVWTNHTFSTIFENFQINSGETDYVPLVWKDTFPNRTDFMTGGLANDYLTYKIWGGSWEGTNPWQALKENGGGWARVVVTNVHSEILKTTPVEKWGTLPWKDEYWACQEYAEEVMREAQVNGLRLYLVFQLGDTGFNYGFKQDAPMAWKGLNVTDMSTALENYTYTTAKYYQSCGLNIEVYEIGNEIQWGILDFILYSDRVPPPSNGIYDIEYLKNTLWSIEAQLLKGGVSGLRRANPDAKIVLHVAGFGYTEYEEMNRSFFQVMIDEGVDFDYAGITHPYPQPNSYGPRDAPWGLDLYSGRSWFQHMQTVVNSLAELGKKVLICEASYPFSKEGEYCDPMPDYPFTPEGQAAWLRDQLLFASNNEDVDGWFYFYFDYFPGFSPDSRWVWEDSMGLFVRDAQPQPAMREFLMGRTPAAYEFSELTVNPAQVEVDDAVTVSVNVKNTGGISGIYSVDMKLNGLVEESKKVTLESGAQTTLNFTVTKAVAGSYNVEVGSLRGSFTVKNPPKPASFSVMSLVISKALVKQNEEVTVSAILENTGELSGAYTLVFSLDGVQRDSSYVTIDGGKMVSKSVKFSSGVEGIHMVAVGGESVKFEVEKVQTGIDGYSYESMFLGLILVTLILITIRKKQNTQ